MYYDEVDQYVDRFFREKEEREHSELKLNPENIERYKGNEVFSQVVDEVEFELEAEKFINKNVPSRLTPEVRAKMRKEYEKRQHRPEILFWIVCFLIMLVCCIGTYLFSQYLAKIMF